MGAHSENSKPVAQMSDAELCQTFDKRMLSPAGCHSLSLRVTQCEAGVALRVRGVEALPAIIAHLEAHRELERFDLRQAWGLQLYTMQLRIDPDDKSEIGLWDTAGWLAWAKTRVA